MCRYNGFRLTVGPDSAGASPGPLCYGHDDATELTLTDVNLVLGRVVDDRFPFPLDKQPAAEQPYHAFQLSELLARRPNMESEEIPLLVQTQSE